MNFRKTFILSLLLTPYLYSCKEILKNDPTKEVLLVGKPEPMGANGWRKMGDFFNENATFTYLFVINGKAYFRVTMLYQKLESDFWEYDPINNRFSPKKELPTKVGGKLFMAIGNNGYYGPGYTYDNGTATDVKEFWQYNPDGDSWIRKSDIIVNEINFPGVFVIGNDAYVCGWQGENGYRTISDLYQYNSITDTWSKKNANYPLSPYLTTRLQFGINGKGYVFGGGFGKLNNGSIVDSLYTSVYDPNSDSFSRPSRYTSYPYNYVPQTSWVLKNKIFTYFGGKDFNYYTHLNEIWEFNTDDLVWRKNKDFGGPIRHAAFGFAIGEKSYICFGNDTGLTKYLDIWEQAP